MLDESERNSKALFSWIGFKKIEFLYDRDKRVAGKTKWNYFKLFHLAMDGITSFTTVPLKIATWLGGIVSCSAVRYASTMIVLLFLGGVQLLSLGIIGEYLGRVFMQTKGRPNYLIEEEKLKSNDD